MTASPRHENSNARLQEWLQKIGAKLKVNTDDGGKKGWKFPPILRNGRAYPYIADTFCTYNGVPLCFEIDYKYHESKQAISNDKQREADLRAFGITICRLTPKEVDILDEELLRKEIAYRMERQ